jgi:DNA repair protein SbcD/Mre11
MKILHTSDWHLGRRLHGFNMIEAQKQFLDHLVEVIKDHQIDVLIVSGDIFDRGYNPQLDAQELFDDALNRLSEMVTIVGISGNHDQPRRLSYGAKLFKRAGIHLFTGLDQLLDPLVVGEGNDQVAFYGIPFLDPSGISERLAELGISSEGTVIPQTDDGVISVVTDAIHEHSKTYKYINVVVLSHAWFVGGEKSDSVSETVGGVGPARLSTVSRFTYAALGHLHTPITLAENVRYSGSPVYYSFSERHKPKSSWLVEINGGNLTVDQIHVPVYRVLTEITGTVAECVSGKYEKHKDDFIKIKLTELEPHAADKLQAYFPHFLTLDPPKMSSGSVDWGQIDSESPIDVCCAAFEFNIGKQPSEPQKKKFVEAISKISAGEGEDQ